jgi:transcriptional regulator with XRE-family HTH domain
MARKKKSSRGKLRSVRKPRVGIPARLTAIRTLKGWSQNEAAEAIGISPYQLRELETGDRPSAADELLVRVADGYGASLDHIYGRSESAIERYAAATPEVQSTQIGGILAGLALMTQNRETLQFVDELVTMLANELPDWKSLQSFHDAPAPERMTMLQELANAVGRLVRDRTAIKYVGALVLRYAMTSSGETPHHTYSIERDEASLSHRLNAIEHMFGHSDSSQTSHLTPSRYKVADARPVIPQQSTRSKPRKSARKK